jgi:hypothetical protein
MSAYNSRSRVMYTVDRPMPVSVTTSLGETRPAEVHSSRTSFRSQPPRTLHDSPPVPTRAAFSCRQRSRLHFERPPWRPEASCMLRIAGRVSSFPSTSSGPSGSLSWLAHHCPIIRPFCVTHPLSDAPTQALACKAFAFSTTVLSS